MRRARSAKSQNKGAKAKNKKQPDALDQSADTASQRWNDYFSKRHPKPSDFSETIYQLNRKSKHEEIIAAIEAALIHGQAQPWMYDALGISMEIVHRPKKQIERVLLSRVDFSAVDVPSMLYSAAYLHRFGARKQSLRMYRQASRLAPTRPEPYVLGLKLARQQKDYDAIGWAATGILTYAWTKDRKLLHDKAEDAITEARQALEKAGRNDQAAALKSAMEEARKRDLILKLSWSGSGDLDLLVEEPLGSVCSFANPQSIGGGILVHDGYGPQQSNCYEEYVCAFGMPGTYRIRIRQIRGDIVGQRAQLKIVLYRGTPFETQRTLSVPLDGVDQIVRLALRRGRRKKSASVESSEAARPRMRRRSRLAHRSTRTSSGSRAAARRFGASQRRADRINRGKRRGVGFQPVITTLSEGVSMSAMAVISGDRRYVRLNMAPSFSTLTDVFTFSFLNNGGNPTGNPGVNPNQGGNNNP